MEYLPHGDGWQPPGRPGATLGSWEATRGGKSSGWYIFPMEEASSRPAGPEQPWGAGGRQGREEQPMVHLPPGGGWQPPGRPGAALGSWEATRGGKSSRWYIFPMEEVGSRQASPELSWGAGGYQGRGEQYGTIFPMEVAGSRQAGPEGPGKGKACGVPDGEGG